MLSRRDFLKLLPPLFFCLFTGCLFRKENIEPNVTQTIKPNLTETAKSKVYVIKTTEREKSVKELLKHFDLKRLAGKKVALKANYNSADPFPATTHLDTLSAVIDVIKENGAASVAMAERSGMGVTESVLDKMGVMELARSKGVEVVILDDLKSDNWIREKTKGSNWRRGILFPKLFKEADVIVQTCCLKTHRFGGQFTMSLKNSVGMVAKKDPEDGYDYMSELHRSPYMRKLIAEINLAYTPEFIIMDGIRGFSTDGPDKGTLIEPEIMIASNDRVALDAAGVAVLRIYGTTSAVAIGEIFKQEQLARAVELGLGASSADGVEVIPINNEAQEICSLIEEKLKERF